MHAQTAIEERGPLTRCFAFVFDLLTIGLTAKDWARFCGHEGLVDLLTPSEKSEHEIMAELDRLQVRACTACVRACMRARVHVCTCLCSVPAFSLLSCLLT